MRLTIKSVRSKSSLHNLLGSKKPKNEQHKNREHTKILGSIFVFTTNPTPRQEGILLVKSNKIKQWLHTQSHQELKTISQIVYKKLSLFFQQPKKTLRASLHIYFPWKLSSLSRENQYEYHSTFHQRPRAQRYKYV